MASPLAVAQFFHSHEYQFDVVVFDEASQIPTADAVVPISRAKQVVVVGDSQQMPPTTFFDRMVAADDDDLDAVEFESVLQDCGALLPTRSLTWHYRSQDERLIAFSNSHFYRGGLLTFPSAWVDRPDLGVKFVHLPDAVYGRGGSQANPEEAERVVELLTEELSRDPGNEIGVTAMSISQAREIQSRVEQRASHSELAREWLEAGGRARNLETVQGDEFDISILSFGYGRNAAGNLQLNFGPLSREDGYKRLNVAITRARKKMIVVSSVRGADIPPERIGQGGRRVRQFLDYAELGPTALAGAGGGDTPSVDVYQSPFEEEVAREIRSMGWSVDTQVGVNRFKVDIGVRHPSQEGRYLAGVECDGTTYHASDTARDRDIGRQRALERLGWRIYRVWSPDWFRRREQVLQDLHRFLTDALDDDEEENGHNGGNSDPGSPRASGTIESSSLPFKPSG